VNFYSDATLAHLCKVADWPDLTGTRYEIHGKIGQGGMGGVFLARDRELERDVALKVLNVLPDNADAKARMVAEARITARLEHPGIVPVHDAGVLPDGRFFYAMKLVRGKRLDEQVGQSTAMTERVRLFLKVCDAVAFAHAHGILHRDLKPQNIMVGPFGEVLVLDWGVAKEVGQPAAGVVLGTPGYRAPEQARGEGSDERADVYALGAILYFLLAGRPPTYEGTAALMRPRSFERTIPRPLEAVCLKALASECADRYAAVTCLSDDVADFLAGRRVRAYPEGPLGTALRVATTYRVVLTLLLAYLIMRILLLVFFRS
jgi:eukaryotic-like serine/threonine-protein kinase